MAENKKKHEKVLDISSSRETALQLYEVRQYDTKWGCRYDWIVAIMRFQSNDKTSRPTNLSQESKTMMLPLEEQNFETLRKKNCYYVDKTRYIYELTLHR